MYRVILAVFLLLLTFPGHAVELTGKPQIIDGDTIEIAGERIRLHGIDAPETKQNCADENGKEWRCGQNAAWALARIIETHWVRCEGDKRDRYGRLIAKCFTGPYDVQAKMVRQGWAMAYRKYSMDYVPQETEAQASETGIWRGQFVLPWEWRRGKRLGHPVSGECPEG